MRTTWAFRVSVALTLLAACSGSSKGFGPDQGTSSSSSGGGSTGDDLGGSSGSSSGGTFITTSDGSVLTGDSGPCKGGFYEGTFAGSYTSHITGVGIPIPVQGNVELTLKQAGSSGQCKAGGEFQSCTNVFTLKDGTITGIADAANVGDAQVGGFPYFCTMTGTLECAEKKLVDGWIQCTYCIGPLADGGMACDLLNGVGGTTGVGGHFAGPLTAGYDYKTLAFILGTWNGAEALAGNDGTMPGPEGGVIADYLSDSGLYIGPGNFGGSGTWNAAFKHP
jgi:hypothetical protein